MSLDTRYPLNLPANALPLRVLIVEDDPMMQLGLEQSLMAHPQLEIVGQAEDGYLGVQAALQLKPDLVVMDIGLPR
ncbi:MAG: response regulator transcription factor, partial [Nostoc sp. C3-bin3]|nr:response regulator transcription factor [Nostoc sp. C3-bin3]